MKASRRAAGGAPGRAAAGPGLGSPRGLWWAQVMWRRGFHDRDPLNPPWLAAVRRGYVTSRDGTRIAYDAVGEGRSTILLANGLGGRLFAWEPLITALLPDCRFVTWDYRGLFDSDMPARRHRLAVRYHVDDAIAVLDAEGGGGAAAAVVGWSMGVQIGLELAATHPERVRGLVLMNGTYGHALSTGFQPLFSMRFVPKRLHATVEWLRARPNAAEALAFAARGAELPVTMVLALTAGARAPLLTPFVRRYFDGVLGPCFGNYLRLFQELDAHSAYHLLPEINAPALIVSGALDVLTPSYQSREMARRMPRAELLSLKRASHFALLERPELLVPRVGAFLRGLGGAPSL
jgi:3-oxoadipate enol-lactonase